MTVDIVVSGYNFYTDSKFNFVQWTWPNLYLTNINIWAEGFSIYIFMLKGHI